MKKGRPASLTPKYWKKASKDWNKFNKAGTMGQNFSDKLTLTHKGSLPSPPKGNPGLFSTKNPPMSPPSLEISKTSSPTPNFSK